MRKVLCFVFFAVLAIAAKDRKEIQPAPLPAQITAAKSIFILKGVGATAHTVEGGYDLAFDAFYSEMKSWGHYELADKAEDADLVMQVSYKATSEGPSVYSSTDTYTKQTSVYSMENFDFQLTLVVFDSHTKAELWSTSVAPGLARRKKNQEKEMINAGQKLATNLRERLPA